MDWIGGNRPLRLLRGVEAGHATDGREPVSDGEGAQYMWWAYANGANGVPFWGLTSSLLIISFSYVSLSIRIPRLDCVASPLIRYRTALSVFGSAQFIVTNFQLTPFNFSGGRVCVCVCVDVVVGMGGVCVCV